MAMRHFYLFHGQLESDASKISERATFAVILLIYLHINYNYRWRRMYALNIYFNLKPKIPL